MENLIADIPTPVILDDMQPLSAVALLESLLLEAAGMDASDLHLCPEREYVSVRVRVDGILRELRLLPRSMHAPMLARLKILAGLRTDEHFNAQDGRFRFTGKNENIDVRLSLAPTYHGEKAVLRLLRATEQMHTLKDLGCASAHRSILARALAKPHGMIISTGPTGSGKTTLLYSLLSMLDRTTRSIVTLEDPIEYSLPGISQIPITSERGLTFANGLRSVLRQDPDVIMVGEIRDVETARLAINASLTGHLVLTTLHTNDAVSTLPRLMDMGIEPYLIASTVQLIIAQRLVRRICVECREPHTPNEQRQQLLKQHVIAPNLDTDTFYRGKGCGTCIGTGFRGRTGIYEMLIVDDEIRDAIMHTADLGKLRTAASARGMRFISEDAVKKAKKGVISLEDVSAFLYA